MKWEENRNRSGGPLISMMLTGSTGAEGGADVDGVAGESGGEEGAAVSHTPSRQYGLARLWAESADNMKTALEALCMTGQVEIGNTPPLIPPSYPTFSHLLIFLLCHLNKPSLPRHTPFSPPHTHPLTPLLLSHHRGDFWSCAVPGGSLFTSINANPGTTRALTRYWTPLSLPRSHVTSIDRPHIISYHITSLAPPPPSLA